MNVTCQEFGPSSLPAERWSLLGVMILILLFTVFIFATVAVWSF